MGNTSLNNAKVARLPNSCTSRSAVGALKYLTFLTILYSILVALSLQRNSYTPKVVSVNALKRLFSEERALRHVESLTNFGIRLAGTKELDSAAAYLIKEARNLANVALETRPDLEVQVSQEFVSGAAGTEFMGRQFVNMYTNLTNILLTIIPKKNALGKAVLINAHFDSTIGSVGASDDASCVGIILETARLFIEDSSRKLESPVVFLMNGGEEALSPAAHGFMQSSKWSKKIGVFINLESTGNQGPDYVFQQTGSWPMYAFAKAAPYPRGSVVAQDFFETGLAPADTDYRMFSANLQGSLPGIDTAFLLGASMYHTDRDTVENIKAGTLQAMGENVVAYTMELCGQLTKQPTAPLDFKRVIYFDILGLFMVVYNFDFAKLLHRSPLVIMFFLPLASHKSFSEMSLTKLYLGTFCEMIYSLLSMVTCLVCAVVCAIVRVYLTKKPMSWYGHDFVPYAFLVPSAFAGILLPYLNRTFDVKIAALGNAFSFAFLSFFLTSAGLGSSFVTMIWAVAAILTTSNLNQNPTSLIKTATIQAVFPALVLLPNSINFTLYVIQKFSLMGAQGQPHLTIYIADGVTGILMAILVINSLGILPPWIAFACGKHGLRAYSHAYPKKVFVQHVHKHDHRAIYNSSYAVGGVDSYPLKNLPISSLYNENLDSSLWQVEKTGWEWQTLFPINEDFIDSLIVEDKNIYTNFDLPNINFEKEGDSGSIDRVHVMLNTPGQGYFGSMNVTGQILNWSLPNFPHSNKIHNRMIRFCGYDRQAMTFWVEIPKNSILTIKLSAANTFDDINLLSFVENWPSWIFTYKITTFTSEWTFSSYNSRGTIALKIDIARLSYFAWW